MTNEVDTPQKAVEDMYKTIVDQRRNIIKLEMQNLVLQDENDKLLNQIKEIKNGKN